MITKKISLFLLFVSVLFSCSNNNCVELISEKNKATLEFEDSCCINDDSIHLKMIRDFSILDNNNYLVTDGSKIVEIDKSGHILSSICKQGHGKDEYIQAGKLYVSTKYIYVWCDMSLQLLQYDKQFNIVNKFDGPGCAISNFIINEDKEVFYYLSGNKDYQIAKKDLFKNSKIEFRGNISLEDKGLLSYQNSASITRYKNDIIFSTPSKMDYYSFGQEKKLFSIIDSDFSNSNYEDTEMRTEYLINYINTNSVTTAMSVYKDMLLILTETGEYVVENYMPQYDKRKINLFAIKNDTIYNSYCFDFPYAVFRYKIQNGVLYAIALNGDGVVIKAAKLDKYL